MRLCVCCVPFSKLPVRFPCLPAVVAVLVRLLPAASLLELVEHAFPDPQAEVFTPNQQGGETVHAFPNAFTHFQAGHAGNENQGGPR